MGTIYNIQRFSLHDGPGIRTTIFFKGCPLRCAWCHNPESQRVKPQLSLMEERCLGCGKCAEACARHKNQDGRHVIDRASCIACGKCVDACPAAALEIMGYEASARDIVSEAERDAVFYSTSGGGVTISGGEPAMQPDFAREILALAKEKGMHTAMETCGHADWAVFQALLPYLDLVLYDMKQTDPALHEKYTGCDNRRIISNLRRLCSGENPHAQVVVRTPVIPGYNDQKKNFLALSELLNSLEIPPRVEILPYNDLAGSKYPRLGMEYAPGNIAKEDGTDPHELRAILASAGIEAKVM